MYLAMPTTNAFIRNANGDILMGKRSTRPGKIYPGLWDIPGGRVEEGEPLETALSRELLEETGLVIVSAKLLHAYHHAGPDIEGSPGINLCYEVQVEGEFSAEDDLKHLEWVPVDKLPAPELLAPWTRAHFEFLGLI
jgi:8-oxo-dGTP pyrophosphatase MutT (NUDIX family)